MCMLLQCIQAWGIELQSPNLDEIFREPGANGGTLIYYGASKTRRSTVSLSKRVCIFGFGRDCNPTCPDTASPPCFNDNGAPNNVCSDLLSDLKPSETLRYRVHLGRFVVNQPRERHFVFPGAPQSRGSFDGRICTRMQTKVSSIGPKNGE
jgi:hypothetical protein